MDDNQQLVKSPILKVKAFSNHLYDVDCTSELENRLFRIWGYLKTSQWCFKEYSNFCKFSLVTLYFQRNSKLKMCVKFSQNPGLKSIERSNRSTTNKFYFLAKMWWANNSNLSLQTIHQFCVFLTREMLDRFIEHVS